MTIDERRQAAVRYLPPLPRALFVLHNFYGVDADGIARRLGTDRETIAACVAEARAMIFAHLSFGEIRRFEPEGRGRRIADLEARLQRCYRHSLANAFAESGYNEGIEWLDPRAGIDADEVTAAEFIVSLMSPAIRRAAQKMRREGVAFVQLWRLPAPWRRR